MTPRLYTVAGASCILQIPEFPRLERAHTEEVRRIAFFWIGEGK